MILNEGLNGNVDKLCVVIFGFEGFWNLFYFKYRICTGNDVNMFRIRFWDNLFIVVKIYCFMIFSLFFIKIKYNFVIN